MQRSSRSIQFHLHARAITLRWFDRSTEMPHQRGKLGPSDIRPGGPREDMNEGFIMPRHRSMLLFFSY